MKNIIHTVLGATGATGQAVIRELETRDVTIRTVSQKPYNAVQDNVSANLLNKTEAIKAIEGSAFVYLCVGLPYQSAVWQTQWPLLMQNVVDACIATNAKLLFFDNVYMYGPSPLLIPFTESHPQSPTTKKGLARKQTTNILLKAITENKINAIIGRSADFYGVGSVNSAFYIMFLQNILKGKAPQVLAKQGVKHTYAFTEDNGKALVGLALDESTYGQVWHLPVGKPITFDEANEMFNAALGTNFKIKYVPFIIRKLLSVFIKPIREVEEMLYQFENPYEMNFDKFQHHFPDFQVTPYETGIKQMVQSFKYISCGAGNSDRH